MNRVHETPQIQMVMDCECVRVRVYIRVFMLTDIYRFMCTFPVPVPHQYR